MGIVNHNSQEHREGALETQQWIKCHFRPDWSLDGRDCWYLAFSSFFVTKSNRVANPVLVEE